MSDKYLVLAIQQLANSLSTHFNYDSKIFSSNYLFVIVPRYEFWANSPLNNDVFLTAYLQKWQQYDLPSGNVDVYFDGFLVTQATLKPNTASTEIPLEIGKVDGVYVEPTLLQTIIYK